MLLVEIYDRQYPSYLLDSGRVNEELHDPKCCNFNLTIPTVTSGFAGFFLIHTEVLIDPGFEIGGSIFE
jgi:hypothetical protein